MLTHIKTQRTIIASTPIIMLMVVLLGCSDSPSSSGSSSSGDQSETQSMKACSKATDYHQQASKDLKAEDWAGAYKNAQHGIKINEGCQVQAFNHLNLGFLLGSKALAEHHLSEGDSRTDINQAITLLAECQTQPEFYGKSIGAQCQTEEEALISYKTDWEMGN